MYRTAEQAAELLAQKGVHATLVNPVCLTSVDEKLLNELAETHSLIVTVEEGILDGGYGQKVASLLGDKDVKVKNFGLENPSSEILSPTSCLPVTDLRQSR